jgi:hypothetical protein
MASFVCKEQLNFLSSEQRKQLTRHFRNSPETAMPHQIAVLLGITYSKALIILTALETEGFSKNKLLIYHICTEEFVDAIPFGIGFPNLPYVCPNCEKVIESYKELSFDSIALTTEPIEFI